MVFIRHRSISDVYSDTGNGSRATPSKVGADALSHECGARITGMPVCYRSSIPLTLVRIARGSLAKIIQRINEGLRDTQTFPYANLQGIEGLFYFLAMGHVMY